MNSATTVTLKNGRTMTIIKDKKKHKDAVKPRKRAATKSRINADSVGRSILDMIPASSKNKNFGHTRTQSLVTEDELIIPNIMSSQNYSVPFTVAINPGVPSSFPWLSQTAQQYERWKVVNLEYYYKPMVSALNANGAQGKVILSADYNALESAPGSRQNAEDTVPHTDGMAWETLRLSLNPSQLTMQPKFIRAQFLPAGSDLTTYDGGNLYISTDGMSTNGDVIGELRCKYTILLTVPVLEPATGFAANAGATYSRSYVSVGAPYAANTALVTNTPTVPSTGGVLTYPNIYSDPNNVAGIVFGGTNWTVTLPKEGGNFILDITVNVTANTGNQLTFAVLDVYSGATGLSILTDTSFVGAPAIFSAPISSISTICLRKTLVIRLGQVSGIALRQFYPQVNALCTAGTWNLTGNFSIHAIS